MKSIILVLAMICTLNINAQRVHCQIFNKDTARWAQIAIDRPYSYWERAETASKEFITDKEGGLTCSYYISIDGINSKQISFLTNEWLRICCPRTSSIVKDSIKNEFITFLMLNGIGQYVTICSTTYINSPTDISISIKDGEAKIKMSTPHYNVGSANFILSTSSSFPLISNCYPFSLKSGHKESYSRAYINTVSEFLNIIEII